MESARVVLASTSPFRRELFARLRIPFIAVAPPFEEKTAPGGARSAEEIRALVLENARGKALSLRAAHPEAWILGSDQLGECEGVVLSKPGTAERAFEQLRFLSGREHRLHTAVALAHGASGRAETAVVTALLRMRLLPETALRRYVELEQPLGSAGSYMIERLGIVLFDAIRVDDPTAVIGLPLSATCRLLEAAGLSPLGTPSDGGVR